KPQRVRTRRESVPEHVDAAVMCALSKMPADRFATAAQFAEALQSPRSASTTMPVAHVEVSPAATREWRRRLPQLAPWGVAIAATAAAGWALASRGSDTPPTTRFVLALPKGNAYFDVSNNAFAISPAGDKIAYLGVGSANASQLYLRSLDQLQPVALTPTEAPRLPAFSPDGKWIAYPTQSVINKGATGGDPTAQRCQ